MAKKMDQLMDHDYDGILEYDNDLPGWWKNLFYITIGISFVYMIHYHVFGTGDLQEMEYLREVDPTLVRKSGALVAYKSPYHDYSGDLTPRMEAELARLEYRSFEEHLVLAMGKADQAQLVKLQQAFPDVYTIFLEGGVPTARPVGASRGVAAKKTVDIPEDLAMLTDAAALASGEALYQQHCVSCHGNLGQGGIGPNLTDEYWLHGGNFRDVVQTVYVGIPAKGMVPWLGTLTADQIHEVSSFIMHDLQGTSPPDAKEPQGEKHPS